MPKISINILTKDRSDLVLHALNSLFLQSFKDFEVIVVNDGSRDGTAKVLEEFKKNFPINLKIISHEKSLGITASRQEALLASGGEYIAILDDDDIWVNNDKLKKQAQFLDAYADYVLVGGGIIIGKNKIKLRPESDAAIRRTMLIKNNFFTSTVMFRKSAAISAGGFIKDADDFGEDYDLWLRLGSLGKMHNFPQAFANYRVPNYNKARYRAFLAKQLRLIYREKHNYPMFWAASILLKLRTLL